MNFGVKVLDISVTYILQDITGSAGDNTPSTEQQPKIYVYS